MKLALTIAVWFLLISTFAHVVSGQSTTCSCEAPDKGCQGSVTCQGGCTAICSSNEVCYMSCPNDLFQHITVKFVHKSGQEIASVLSERTRKRIEFAPYERNKSAQYNLEIKNDDVWNTLKFLHKRGDVRVGGVDFGNLEKIRRDMATGGNISVNFSGIPVKDAVAELSFLSGLPFRVVSGDVDHLLSISLQEVTLSEVVSRISAKTGVKIEEVKKGTTR